MERYQRPHAGALRPARSVRPRRCRGRGGRVGLRHLQRMTSLYGTTASGGTIRHSAGGVTPWKSTQPQPPAREHRLYQIGLAVPHLGYESEELSPASRRRLLDTRTDPKLMIAMTNYTLPVDVTRRASRNSRVRVGRWRSGSRQRASTPSPKPRLQGDGCSDERALPFLPSGHSPLPPSRGNGASSRSSPQEFAHTKRTMELQHRSAALLHVPPQPRHLRHRGIETPTTATQNGHLPGTGQVAVGGYLLGSLPRSPPDGFPVVLG